MRDAMTPGQAAFEKWAELLIPKFSITWKELPQYSKMGWEVIAQAAISAVKDTGDYLRPV